VSEGIRRAGAVAWAVVGLAMLLVLAGLLAWVVRVIWPPLILAGAIVFILNPVVMWLQGRGIPRALAVGASYLGVLALVALTVVLVYPLARDQGEQLGDDWPDIRKDLQHRLDDLAAESEDWPIKVPTWQEFEDEFGNGNGKHDDDTIAERVDRVRDIGARVFHIAIIFILAPIIAFYLLVDLPRLRRVMLGLIPKRAEREVLVVAHRLNRAIGGFFRGQLLVALIVGVMVSIGLFAIDLPFWLLIGMVAGIFNIIPLIGPWVGAVPGVIIALTTRDVTTAVWVAVIMLVAQQIDNHFISPIVMQRVVKLHPAAVMMALLAGGTIGGFFGLLLAVPTAAVLKIIVGHLWHTYVLGEPFEAEATVDDAPGVGMVEDVTSGADSAAPTA
jgi:predicted PurR-regulated permease PerM